MKGAEIAELHSHLGSSGSHDLMWDIAHRAGFRLPTKDFWEFKDMMTVRGPAPKKTDVEKFNEYLSIFDLTEKIQSSPMAMERIVYDAIGGAYRNSNITTFELRYSPMVRNREGERDLDHIIVGSLNGLERAMLAYPKVKAGIVFMLDRRFSFRENKITFEKALKYKNRGVVGVDICGPRRGLFDYMEYKEVFEQAKKEGFGTTVHTGEEGDSEEMKDVIQELPLDRIGHGIKAAWDEEVMKMLVQKNIVLEICPTSNLRIGTVKNIEELKFVFDQFLKNKVKFTISTDNPVFFDITILDEFEFLLDNKILTLEQILKANKLAHEASFVNK